MKKSVVAVSLAMMASVAAANITSRVYTGSEANALQFPQLCYTNGALCAIADPAQRVVFPVGTFGRDDESSEPLVFTNTLVYTGYALDEWMLVRMEGKNPQNVPAQLSDARVYTNLAYSMTGSSVSIPQNGGLSGMDDYMALAPAFSWLKYQLRYWKNDGTTVSMLDVDFFDRQIYTNVVTVMENPWTRYGYDFLGWSPVSNTTEVAFTNRQTATGADFAATTNGVNLFAVWDRIIVAVSLDGNGATESFEPTSLSVGVGDRYELPAPVRENYTFAGWRSAKAGGILVTNGQEVTDISITNLYAQWELEKFTVSVGSSNPRYGTVNEAGDYLLDYGEALYLDALPADGCRFDGWSDGVTNLSRMVTCESNAVYWANFSVDTDSLNTHEAASSASEAGPEKTTVYFLANGGIGEMEPQTPDNPASFVLTDSTFTGTSPFLGWATTSTATEPEYVNCAEMTDVGPGPLVLYAVWQGAGGSEASATCAIWFDANGGTGVTESVTLTEGYSTTLPSCGFGRSGYDFLGWAKTADAATNDLADAATVDAIADVASSADAEWCVLHAVWAESAEEEGGDGTNDLSRAAHSNIALTGSDWTVSTYDSGLGEVTNGILSTADGAQLTASVTGPGVCGFTYVGAAEDDRLTVSFTGGNPAKTTTVEYVTTVDNEDIPQPVAVTTNISIAGKISVRWTASAADSRIDGIRWDEGGSGGESVVLSNAMFVVRNASYDGEPHVGVVETIGCELESEAGNEATDPGKYSVTLRLGDGRCWPDGSTNSTTNVVWSISVPNSIAYFHAFEGLSCDSTMQTGVVAVAGCEVEEGNVAADAGEHVATLRLVPGSHWPDGSTAATTNVAWSIARGGVDMSGVTFSDAVFVATNGYAYGIRVDGELPAAVTNVVYEGNEKTAAGEYTVTATFLVDEANYVPIDPSSLSATMRLIALFDPDAGVEPVEGDLPAGAISYFDTNKVYDTEALVPDPMAIRDAFAPYSPTRKVQFSYSESGPWSNAPVGLTDAGTTDVWYQVEVSDSEMFRHAIRLTVTPLDIADAEAALATNEWLWTGSEIEPEPSLTINGNVLVEGTDYEVAYSNNVDAGTATATVTGIGSCTGSVSVDFEIVTVECDMSGLSLEDAAYIYDGKIKSLAVSGSLPEGVAGVTYLYDGEEVAGVTGPGEFDVTAVFSFMAGYHAAVSNLSAQLTIAKDASEYDGPLATVGDYCSWTLPQLGVPLTNTVPTTTSVSVKGLPAGLKLVKSKVYGTGRNKKKVVGYDYFVRGVPTSAVDAMRLPMYIAVKDSSGTTWHPVEFNVAAQEVADLGQDLGTWMVGAKFDGTNWLAGVGSGWTVSGLPTGLKYTPKAIYRNSKKKSLGRYPAFSVYGTMKAAGLFTITAKKKNSAGFYVTRRYRVLVTPRDVYADRFPGLENRTLTAYEPFATWTLADDVASAGGKVTAISGLPAGLGVKYAYTNAKKKTGKYAASIYGMPTKAGTFALTFKKGTVARTVLWVVEPSPTVPSLDFNTNGGVTMSAKAGVRQYDLLAFAATSNATLTASGLPSTVKLVRLADGTWGFAGRATAAGTYLVTVKATLNGRSAVQRMALEFEGLPAWAVGSYNGIAGALGDDVESIDDFASFDQIVATNGLARVSVASSGKISGSCRFAGTNWTLSATCFTGCTDDCYEATNLLAKATYTYYVRNSKGKSVKKTGTSVRFMTLRVQESDLGETVRGAVVACENEGDAGFGAEEYLWTANSKYKAIGRKLFYTSSKKQYVAMTFRGSSETGAALGLAADETLKMKIAVSGVATATLVKGKASATCSTVVLPATPAEYGYEAFVGGVPFYFAPVKGGIGERAGMLRIE